MVEQNSLTVNVFIKKEEELWVGHCMELDIVATGSTPAEVKKDMEDLIVTQVAYAFSNDNLDHLFRPAPAEVWEEFYKCRQRVEDKLTIESDSPGERRKGRSFVPPWVIANICQLESSSCHA
ncbi:MAG: hypothetical protein ACLFMN_07895 [Desulfobacterales bacterium]